jgi:starch synthase (maltosyl-transferring)
MPPTSSPARSHPLVAPSRRPDRVRLGDPRPRVDGSASGPKRTVGDRVALSATVVRDGHEVMRADLRVKGPGDATWTVTPMHEVDPVSLDPTWAAEVTVDRPGAWTWSVQAYVDELASWRHELHRKVDGNQADVSVVLAEGALLLAAAAKRAEKTDRLALEDAAATVGDSATPQRERIAAALHETLAALCDRTPDTKGAAKLPAQPLDVDPVLARFGAWYELFPRSWGGLAGVRRRLPALAELGFDVIYLPPISPIGLTNRKGRNNTLTPAPTDPGSPWAIGDATGGHDGVHTELGTIDDLVALAADARDLGMEIALDLAVQCSADHPWLTEHPEWFNRRPDGTLKYAENPPKKYQDIYNVDFDCADWQGLWQAIADVVLTWVDRGVHVFRVDNPHTKPVAFWAWLIAGVRAQHPEVVFLAEAFTDRAMMQELGRAGFSQGYTYFTWKQTAAELTEYVSELAGEERNLFRPNFFTNTPDILTEQLQTGGPSTFASRLILAATLSPSYGIYSGFESFDHVAVKEGSEEYLDSEKFEARQRTLDGTLLPLVRQLNDLRRAHPALQHLDRTRFLTTENDQLVAYAKQAPDGSDTVLSVVLLDGADAQEGVCVVPDDLGLPPSFEVIDELTGDRFAWHLGHNYVRLEPSLRPAHLLSVVR